MAIAAVTMNRVEVKLPPVTTAAATSAAVARTTTQTRTRFSAFGATFAIVARVRRIASRRNIQALIPQPGALAEGTAAIRDSLRWFLDRRGEITLETKLVVRVGDLAFLANRWSLAGGTMPDGSPAELGATTAEVARLQPDGTWLYVIDNAWGDEAAS
jgi:ketosteroid isomerase-like protein